MGAPTDRCAHVWPSNGLCGAPRSQHNMAAMSAFPFDHAFVEPPSEAAFTLSVPVPIPGNESPLSREDARVARERISPTPREPEAAPDEAAAASEDETLAYELCAAIFREFGLGFGQLAVTLGVASKLFAKVRAAGIAAGRKSAFGEAEARVVQACIDWVNDTGDCHFCGYTTSGGKHDEDCPLGPIVARGEG